MGISFRQILIGYRRAADQGYALVPGVCPSAGCGRRAPARGPPEVDQVDHLVLELARRLYGQLDRFTGPGRAELTYIDPFLESF